MVRKRFAADGEADKDKIVAGSCAAGSAGCDQREVLKGYKKLALLLILFVAVSLFRTYAFDIATVYGSSMEPSFFQGDILLVRSSSSDIERHDVVVAKALGKKVIKRVVAMPGEMVQIVNGKVLVNGKELCGQYAFYTEETGVAGEPFLLGKDEYFLLGDNRGASADSRVFGSVGEDDIKGVVVFQFWPLSGVGKVSHGEDRAR